MRDKGTTILEIKSWLSNVKTILKKIAFFLQYYSQKLLFQIKRRAPHLKKLHIDSFPAIHIRKMDWMDFILKFSSELLVLSLAFTVAGMNLLVLNGDFNDKSLAANFLNLHPSFNPKLNAKNTSIVTVVSTRGFISQAQAEDFVGLDSRGLATIDNTDPNNDLIIGTEDTILAPNPDSVQVLIEKQIKIYQTQNGDSLGSVAKKFGISPQTIMWANKLTNQTIKPGWQLIILPVDGVLVEATNNDTLPDIANKYNPQRYNNNKTIRDASRDQLLDKIISYNGLENAEDIDGGQFIIVPNGAVVEAPKPAPKPKSKPKTAPKDNSIDSVTSVSGGYDDETHTFPKGYCTYYVASRMRITFGGNAKNWLANARASGYVVSKEPAPRTSVVTTDNRRYGHVAYVEEVTDTAILVSEMNFVGFNKINQRWIPINSPTIRGYIYP